MSAGLVLVAQLGCGGGNAITLPPASLAYSANPAVYTKGTAITANVPSHRGGAIRTFAVDPALPSGLRLNASTGVITGTPTSLSAAASYTLTARNDSGSATTSLSLMVNDVAPNALSYPSGSVTWYAGVALPPATPSHGGGAIVAYAIAPELPPGLELDPRTGAISGTPSGVAGTTTYTITAINSGGSATFPLTLTVIPTPPPPAHLAYSPNPAVEAIWTAIPPCTPHSTGGAIDAYSVSPALPPGLALDPATGVITGIPTRLAAPGHHLITASNISGSTTADLIVSVTCVAPSDLTYSSRYQICTVGTAMEPLTPISTGGAPTSYAVSPALPAGLSISPLAGVISGTPTLVKAAMVYTIRARNDGGSATANLTLTVNDIPPSALSYPSAALICYAGIATAPFAPRHGGGAVVSYAVSPTLPPGLILNGSSGVISGTPDDTATWGTYIITATNSGGSASFALTLQVIPAPLKPANLTYGTNPATYTFGTTIPPNAPSSAGGAIATYSISPALPAGLTLDPLTGVISGTPTRPAAPGHHIVTARNVAGTATADLVISVVPVAPSGLTYSENPAVYRIGSAITPNTPSISGGLPTSYSISSALPAGLSLDPSTGIITGTPTAVHSAATYTIRAKNGGGSATAVLSITIKYAVDRPTGLAYSANPAVYVTGVAITPNAPSSTGGPVDTYTAITRLPAGLSLDRLTGVISGTPTTITPTATYTIAAANIAGYSAAQVTLTVDDSGVGAPNTLRYSANPAVYTKGVAIPPNTPTSGGGDPTRYSIGPALPTGLVLDPATGVITGTPGVIASTTRHTVSASNASGKTTVTLTLTVNDAVPYDLDYTYNPYVFVLGVPGTAGPPAHLGGAVVSYAADKPLPAGLALDPSTGVVAGTPTVLQAMTTYVVTATNSGGSARASLVIVVSEPPPTALGYSANPAVYAVRTAIAPNSPSSGGGHVVSYAIAPPLPTGLVLDRTSGVITGTPTAISPPTDYTVTASNLAGSASATLNIRIANTTPAGLAYAYGSAAFNLGVPITPDVPSTTAGVGITYTISPALPAGLGLDPATGVISGTPSALAPAAAYAVTAMNELGSATVDLRFKVVPVLAITAGPDDQAVHFGQAATFTATATGTGPLTYQWQRDDADLPYETATSTTTPTLALSDTGHHYRLVVSDTYGSQAFSREALLTVFKGRFTRTGTMTSDRWHPTTISLKDGTVLIAYGQNVDPVYPEGITPDADLYSPASGTFTRVPLLDFRLDGPTAALIPDGKVLFAGGHGVVNGVEDTLRSAELFDPTTGTSTPTGSMAWRRRNHTATTLLNGKVLITGGETDYFYPSDFGPASFLQDIQASAELYDPATGLFSRTDRMAYPRTGHKATLLPNGKVLITGGRTELSYIEIEGPWTDEGPMYTYKFKVRTAASSEIYDPATGTFSLAGTMGTARQDHAATLLPNGMVLIGGGQYYVCYGDPLGSYIHTVGVNSAELFDPATGTSVPVALSHFLGTVLPDGTALMLGGGATTERFDEITGIATPNATMLDMIYIQTATTLPNGKVLVTGGISSFPAELYDPE